MRSIKSIKALIIVLILLAISANAQSEQEKRISEIQAALKQQGFDGWLFYDFRGSDILTPRILKTERLGGSRRWFYFVPTEGEPVKVSSPAQR